MLKESTNGGGGRARRAMLVVPAALAAALALAAAPAAGGPAPLGPSSEIRDRAYAPSAITVAAGQTITWRNETLGPHTVTSTTELFNSGRIESQTAYSLRFANPGTFNYYCTVHPTMKGVVTVLAAPAETVLVHLASRHTAHGRSTTVQVQVARAGVQALLQAAPARGHAFRTIARAPLGSQGTASFALRAGAGPRLRVLVPAAYGEPRLLSRTVTH
jgi:plastocyanin